MVNNVAPEWITAMDIVAQQTRNAFDSRQAASSSLNLKKSK